MAAARSGRQINRSGRGQRLNPFQALVASKQRSCLNRPHFGSADSATYRTAVVDSDDGSCPTAVTPLRGQGCPLSGCEQSFRFAAVIRPRCANCRGEQVQQRPCTETGSTRLPRQRWQAAQENASAGSTAASAIREPPAISSAGAAGTPLAFGHGGSPVFPPRMHNAAPLQECRRGVRSCNLYG
jgi:hypothetical protein